MKLVRLGYVWQQLGHPDKFQAKFGLPGCAATGLIIDCEVCDESPRLFYILCKNKEVLDSIPAEGINWVPLYEEWKQQKTTQFTDIKSMVDSICKESVKEEH